MPHTSYHTRRVLDLHAFLSFFEDVRTIGDRGDRIQYEAKCPAHETRHRSLALAVFRDGTYGVHCHAGCTSAAVLEAVGLSLKDLYPDGAMFERKRPRRNSQADVDRNVLEIAQGQRKQGAVLKKSDKAREREAWLASKRRGPFG